MARSCSHTPLSCGGVAKRQRLTPSARAPLERYDVVKEPPSSLQRSYRSPFVCSISSDGTADQLCSSGKESMRMRGAHGEQSREHLTGNQGVREGSRRELLGENPSLEIPSVYFFISYFSDFCSLSLNEDDGTVWGRNSYLRLEERLVSSQGRCSAACV